MLLRTPLASSPETPSYEWVTGGGGSGVEIPNKIAIDAFTNIYVLASLTGEATYGTNALHSRGERDILILKYLHDGTLMWCKQFGGVSRDTADGLAVDSAGNVLVVGKFEGDFIADGFGLTSQGDTDAIVLKLDTSGNLLWVRQIGGSMAEDGVDVAIGPSDNVVVTGTFSGRLDVGSTSLISSGAEDLFIAKLSASAEVIWAHRAGGPGNDEIVSIAVDGGGNCFLTGEFIGLGNFGSQVNVGLTNHPSVFVSKLNASGEFEWTLNLGARQANESQLDIAVTTNGVSYVVGTFKNSIQIGATLLTSITALEDDLFIAKLLPEGAIEWATRYGTGGKTHSQSLAITPTGDVLVCGTESTAALSEGFLVVFSPGGDPLRTFSESFDVDGVFLEVAINGAGHTAVAGSIYSTNTFGGVLMTSMGERDVFIAKVLGLPEGSSKLSLAIPFVTSEGFIRISGQTPNGVVFRLEESANLRQWNTRLNGAGHETFEFVDETPSPQLRFYRLVSP